jgi:hypothetical protein
MAPKGVFTAEPAESTVMALLRALSGLCGEWEAQLTHELRPHPGLGPSTK